MSTINQRRLIMARRIATKLVISSAMTENPVIGPRTLTVPVDLGDSSMFQIVNKRASLFLSAPGPICRATCSESHLITYINPDCPYIAEYLHNDCKKKADDNESSRGKQL